MIVVGQPLAPPRLRGTDSQIAWALRIRAQMLPEIHAIRDGSAGRLRIGALSSEEAEGYSAIVEAADTLIAEERAGWWIDRRGHSTHSLLHERVEAASPGGIRGGTVMGAIRVTARRYSFEVLREEAELPYPRGTARGRPARCRRGRAPPDRR